MVFVSHGRTVPARAMVNNSGLDQIKNNMNKATIYKVMDIKCEKMSKPLKILK